MTNLKKIYVMTFNLFIIFSAYGSSQITLQPSEAKNINDYLKQPEPLLLFKQLSKSGELKDFKSKMLETCSDEKKRINGFCECFKQDFTKLTEKEIFFSQMYLTEIQENLTKAMGAGDNKALGEAMKKMNQTPIGVIEQKCKIALSKIKT
ncbi:hypothetical protein [Algibacillus agarilyticus]|uniref:hypothetical protein n=1 Tax=Algibacillus agarilyticus TaxID=2234133 RepID=UPI000DCF6CC1|nr:hypothetical protein [Algibacillus agarilyticus]